jgi:hypothetical protein
MPAWPCRSTPTTSRTTCGLRLGRTRSTDEQLQHKAALATNAVKLMPKAGAVAGGVVGGVVGKDRDSMMSAHDGPERA